MDEVPMLTVRRLIRALKKAGFEVPRQTGSHVRLKHPDENVVTGQCVAARIVA
jgi:predicted RNA binding protein YcfA (HicA-like mRNA interferase family)